MKNENILQEPQDPNITLSLKIILDFFSKYQSYSMKLKKQTVNNKLISSFRPNMTPSTAGS